MSYPDYRSNQQRSDWERFCDFLWFDDELGFWLDISKINIDKNDLENLRPKLIKSLESMNLLEKGSIANIDENRQVGHYWLRNPKLAPEPVIKEQIEIEIERLETLGKSFANDTFLSPCGKKYTDVLWIGIGGSGLGPLLLIEALQEQGKGPHFHFLDNVDPEGIQTTLDDIEGTLATTLAVVVSKSGGTPEPRLCMELAKKYFKDRSINWSNQAIAITTKGSKLDSLAKKEGWLDVFDLPDWVGGRTSITSAVGLLPIALIGKDIKSFLYGASRMDKLTRSMEITENPALLLASSWWVTGKASGERDMVVLPYKDRLQVLSRYLQQLVMESIGKKYDRLNNEVNQGLAVYGNKGSTDQHAYVQQLRDGLDNFFVNFIEVINHKQPDNNFSNSEASDYLSGFLQGTRSALTEAKKQSLTISIRNLDCKSLGALIALYERTVGIYGELVNINAYHQPGVEAGKKAAADVLEITSRIKKLIDDQKQFSIEEITKQLDCNPETVYYIMRSLVENNSTYKLIGTWNEPNNLIIQKEIK